MTKTEGRLRYSYADLADVLEAIRQPLSKHGLALMHRMHKEQKTYMLQTILMHESGEYIDTWYPLPDPGLSRQQVFGGALTYARRYSVSALVGIASDDDVDGQDGDDDKPPEKKPVASASAAQPPAEKKVTPNHTPASKTQISRIASLAEERTIDPGELGYYLKYCYPGVNSQNMKHFQAQEIITLLEDKDTSPATLMAAAERAKTQLEANQGQPQ